MKRALLLAFGAVALVVSLAAGVAGGVLWAIFGTDGSYEAGAGTLTSRPESVALVSDVLGIDGGVTIGSEAGRLSLGARSPNGRPLFVGLAPSDRVDAYLAGHPYDVTTRSDGVWRTVPVPGTGRPEPPAGQSFWIAQAEGPAPSVRYDGNNGQLTLVVMQADASPGVVAEIRLGFASRLLFPLTVTLLIGGGLFLIIGVVLLLLGIRAGRAGGPRHAGTAVGSPPIA